MKPEEDNESWQKAGCLLVNCDVGQSLGKPIQYKLNKILPDSEDWLADRRWVLISISPTIHFCNSVDHHIINSKSYEVALNPETKMM